MYHNGFTRIAFLARVAVALASVLALGLLVGSRPASAQETKTLWYNGDLFGQIGRRNQIGGGTEARVFDNFLVTDPLGWRVEEVFSNNYFLSLFPPSGTLEADWSIRTGVSEGNGGTIVAGGVASATAASTGRIPNFLYREYQITVSGLDVFLAPGMYWLNVTPVYAGDAFVSGTRGRNAVGLPAGSDGNAFLDVPRSDIHFAEQTGPTRDFSMGVRGQAIPEPGSLALLAAAGVVLPLAARGWRLRRGGRTGRGGS